MVTVMSKNEGGCLEVQYLNHDAIKSQYLKIRVAQAKEDIAAGRTVDGKQFIDDLVNGVFDD
jgi:hypothetical protein